MKLRSLQVLFVVACLSFAAMVVHHGQPHLLSPTQAQGEAQDGRGRPPEALPADRQAAVAAIQAQLDAFRKDDFITAMRYQSAGLKLHFPSPAAFRQMMQAGYPAFLHFQSVVFRDARTPDHGSHLFVLVTLRQADGSVTRALYFMVREHGAYKIDGVGGGMGPGGGSGSPPVPGADGPGQLT